MNSPEQIRLAALAGLLHDIGKLMLRADHSIEDAEAGRGSEYKHAMLSAHFVEEQVPEPWRRAVSESAGNHHRPRPHNTMDLAVTLADILSAAERDDGTQDEDVHQSHPRQLLSIFAQLTADERRLDDEARDRAYLPLRPLALEKDVLFPGPSLASKEVWSAYTQLYNDFLNDSKGLRDAHQTAADLDAYLESMLLLLQRYTWAVPSAYYRGAPDISLYDHSRTTAALAAVLMAGGHDAATLERWVQQPETDAEVALLVGADLSGVQDFIYTITSRGAASALRGRSFYLQLLTEAAARFVLRELGLPSCNLLYAGGGNFYLLAAPQHADALVEVQRRISRVLLHHHRGDLYLALATTPLRGADFFPGKISAARQRLGERLQEAKLRRFAELEADDLARLFVPQEDGGNEERQCHVCGLEHPNIVVEEDVRKCRPCRSFEELGKDLRQARFLLMKEVAPAEIDPSAAPGDYVETLAALGMYVEVSERHPAVPPERATLLALKDDVWPELIPQTHLAVGRRFLVNTTPILRQEDIDELQRENYQEEVGDESLQPDKVKPFSVLAWEATGIKRLGVLRMDVDNLGQLFAKGLGDLGTLSRDASLSFAISLYFEGWVEQIAQKHEGRIYSIYSGGDDLFFVGAWDAVVEFAREVRADFTPYVAHHPGLHTSAGIVLAARKYPLAQAARDAGDAEDKAKAYQGPGGRRKDAVCFLGVTQPWTRFGLEPTCAAGGDSVHALMHLLLDMTKSEDGGAPKALLRNLVRLYDQYQDEWEKRRQSGRDVNRAGELQALWGPWIWRGAYMLSRMAGRLKGQWDMRQLLDREQFSNMDWIGLAARWAELLSR